jgi:DNA-binding transcriptional MocR family regulator
MWSLDRDTVIRLGSFSKSLSPGMRIGFLTAAPAIIDRIGDCGLLDSGGGVNHFASMIVGEMMHSGAFQSVALAGQLRYAERRAALVGALDSSLLRFAVPHGGYFVWVELPEGVPSSRAVAAATAHGVQVADGRNFFVGADDSNAVRLSFSMLSSAELREGAGRLNAAIGSLV